MQDLERTLITFRYERLRAVAAGILETAATVFLLLIAVRRFDAGPLSKALIAAGGSFGLVLTPLVVSIVKGGGWEAARAASVLSAVAAASFLTMAAMPFLAVYVTGSVIALAMAAAIIPLLTQIFHENYPDDQRGQLFARTVVIRIATAAVFSYLAGKLLSEYMDRFQWLLLTFALASGLAAFCLARCPSRPLAPSNGAHPFHALRYAREDRVFRQTLIAWMFLGFAMLMMSPLRVEYLANPRYGVRWNGEVLTAGLVALLTGVIPNLARLAFNPLWGRWFDRVNFFILRLTLNLGFAIGIVSFFTTGTVTGLIVGAVVFGISSAGADLAWSLWVTKFAPPERVADYMSVHTFFTGLRGLVAPLVAFHFVAGLSPFVMGWISIGLIAVGSAFLVPEIKHGWRARPAVVLIEENRD